MDPELRIQLNEITQILDVSQHLSKIEMLRKRFGHTIVLREESVAVDEYTCAVHAFDLTKDPTYDQIRSFGLRRTFAGAEFVEFLLNETLLNEKSCAARAAGDLLIYLDQGKFGHAGKLVAANLVASKWGTGQLWEHGIWEVPIDYGFELKIFQTLAPGEGLALFIEFAKSKGFRRAKKNA